MTFTIQKKSLLKKLKKRRKYEHFLTSHFSGKQMKFDNMADFDSEDEEEKNEISEDIFDETGLFYSWECVSFIKNNGSTLDLVIPSASDLMTLIHIVHRHVY